MRPQQGGDQRDGDGQNNDNNRKGGLNDGDCGRPPLARRGRDNNESPKEGEIQQNQASRLDK